MKESIPKGTDSFFFIKFSHLPKANISHAKRISLRVIPMGNTLWDAFYAVVTFYMFITAQKE